MDFISIAVAIGGIVIGFLAKRFLPALPVLPTPTPAPGPLPSPSPSPGPMPAPSGLPILDFLAHILAGQKPTPAELEAVIARLQQLLALVGGNVAGGNAPLQALNDGMPQAVYEAGPFRVKLTPEVFHAK